MSVTYSTTRIGGITRVTVTSTLTPPVYYHWWLDGSWVASTGTDPTFTFSQEPGTQTRIEVLDTTDANETPEDLALSRGLVSWPGRRTLWWVRSTDTSVLSYRVEQNKASGGWVSLATIPRDGEAWSYAFVTDRLDDLTNYEWRVYPVDAAGNDGTVIALGIEKIVRWPDSPDFTATFDAGTTKVTFSAAA